MATQGTIKCEVNDKMVNAALKVLQNYPKPGSDRVMVIQMLNVALRNGVKIDNR